MYDSLKRIEAGSIAWPRPERLRGRLLSPAKSLRFLFFFFFERKFPAMNILILICLFWTAVPGHEQISFTSAFFHFYFNFNFIIKMFCFVLKFNKMNLFPVQWKTKWFDVLLSLYFQCKIIKVQSRINKFMSFWWMAVVGHHTLPHKHWVKQEFKISEGIFFWGRGVEDLGLVIGFGQNEL